jgi:hypothetical protein
MTLYVILMVPLGKHGKVWGHVSGWRYTVTTLHVIALG